MPALHMPPAVQYGIDESDHIVFVNDEWLALARANQGTALLPPAVLKQSLWSHISDRTTRQLYRDLLLKVRSQSTSLHIPLRCDTHTCRRWHRLDIAPLPHNQVLFTSSLVRVEMRPNVALFDPTVERSTEFLTACSWCKKVAIDPNRWVEVEQAIDYLELFQRDTLPQITHGMCLSCLDSMTALLD